VTAARSSYTTARVIAGRAGRRPRDHAAGRALGVEQLGVLASPAAHEMPLDMRVSWCRLCHVAEKCPKAS
jgi:hypothetical protein